MPIASIQPKRLWVQNYANNLISPNRTSIFLLIWADIYANTYNYKWPDTKKAISADTAFGKIFY